MKNELFSVGLRVWHPGITDNFKRWAQKLEYLSPKRKNMILLTAYTTLRGFGALQQYKQTQLIAIIFELDHILDEVLTKDENYKSATNNLLESDKFRDLMSDLYQDLDTEQREEITKSLREFIDTAPRLHSSNITTVDEYLNITRVSIGVPCSTRLVELLSKEPCNRDYLALGAEIVRIFNDFATSYKDEPEQTKNIFTFTNKEDAEKILHKKISEFLLITANSVPEIFLFRLVKISSKLYKGNRDFEL